MDQAEIRKALANGSARLSGGGRRKSRSFADAKKASPEEDLHRDCRQLPRPNRRSLEGQ